MNTFFPPEPAAQQSWLMAQIDRLEPTLRPRIARTLQHTDGCAKDADDVMACVRERVWKALRNGAVRAQCDAELKTYLQHMARNITVDELRGSQRRRRLHRQLRAALCGSVAFDLHVDDGPPSAIMHLLDRLKSPQRDIVELWARGLSHRHIAVAMGVDFEAHRSRWRRVLAVLHLCVQMESDAPAPTPSRQPSASAPRPGGR